MLSTRPAPRELQIISLVGLLVFTVSSIVGAQEKTGAHKSAAVPTAPSNSWEQDGLVGPVRRVRTETASVISKEGKLSEAPRVLTGVITYDWQGNRIDNVYYVAVGTPLTGKETYKYDDKGNIIEMTMRDEKGEIIVQEVYTYEFDPMGNWTKMTTSVALIEGGEVTSEPTEVNYRTIAYYRTDAVLKVVESVTQPAAAASTLTSAPDIPPDTKVEIEKAPGVQTATNDPLPPESSASAATFDKPADGANSHLPDQATLKPSTEAGSTNSDNNLLVSPQLKQEALVAAQLPSPSAAAPFTQGVLNARAIRLPPPIYPEIAKRLGTTGTVTVEVIIDVRGAVISARSVSGPIVLRYAAEQAARVARFSPTLLSGRPVQVGGIIKYKFSR